MMVKLNFANLPFLIHRGMFPYEPKRYEHIGKYWGGGGNHNCNEINAIIVPMENHIFLERRKSLLSKKIYLSMGTKNGSWN